MYTFYDLMKVVMIQIRCFNTNLGYNSENSVGTKIRS